MVFPRLAQPIGADGAGIVTQARSLPAADVLPLAALRWSDAAALLHLYGLSLMRVAEGASIPGSYWGAPEAGLIGNLVYARADTPVHSLLHEAGHFICMDAPRRAALHTDARSDEIEERAVCYLQALLADRLAGYSRARLFADMDAWGYSFVLGSTQAWYERDADDAKNWLRHKGLL